MNPSKATVLIQAAENAAWASVSGGSQSKGCVLLNVLLAVCLTTNQILHLKSISAMLFPKAAAVDLYVCW
jgi:hypothetical protein